MDKEKSTPASRCLPILGGRVEGSLLPARKTKRRLTRYPYVIALISILPCLAIGLPISAQTLTSVPHPNHYILLIDSSGSALAKREAYNKALLDRLPDNLYRAGFGKLIPPYDPNQDLLTLHHFGVVTGELSTAYSRLSTSDLQTDFIHTSWLLRSGVGPDELRKSLISPQSYDYTILSWAKELALLSSKPRSRESVCGRTFLIVVHDGMPNENSLSEEVSMIRRWAKNSFEKVSPIISSIDADYKFTDGESRSSPASAEDVKGDYGSGLPLFIESYEVVSNAEIAWEARGRSLSPAVEFRFRWTKQIGQTPQGVLDLTLTNILKDWLKEAEIQAIQTEIETEGNTIGMSGLSAPIDLHGALSCNPRVVEGALNMRLRRADNYLGTRFLDYSFRNSIVTPTPTRCTARFIAGRVAAGALILLAFGTLTYYWYFRFRATHLQIELPATLGTIRVMRNGSVRTSVSARPQQGLQALSLRLPGVLRQLLFYRGATLTLEEREHTRWSDNSLDGQLNLPLAHKELWVEWETIPGDPSVVTISFRQGGQHSQIQLMYPSGLPDGLSKGASI